MEIANTASSLFVEHIQRIMLHIVIASKKLIGSLSSKYYCYVVCRQFTREIAGYSATDE